MAAKKSTSKSIKIEKADPVYTWPIGIQDASEYLSLSVAALKYHIYVSGMLKGRLVGHSIVFERDELDTFKANKRRPGRPAMAPEVSTAAPA